MLCASTAHAQFGSTQWTAEDGLPQNSVRGIAQTSDGYLWIATLNGLARFDGVRFTVFDKSNTPGMSSTRFMTMIRGANDELWLASEDNNAARFRLGVFEPLGTPHGVAAHSVTGLTGNGRGGVWLGSGGRIMRWDASTSTFVIETFEIDNAGFGPLWWRGTGFWSLRDRRLYCFVRGTMQVHTLPTTFPVGEIHGVAVGGDNTVWIGLAGDRYARVVDGRLVYERGTVETPFVGRRHTWKAIINSNLDRKLVIPSDGAEKAIPYNIISADNERNTWVGSEGQGLFRIREQSIKVYSVAHGLAGDNIYPVLKSRSGEMWIGSWPAGLSRVRAGQVTTLTPRDGLPGLVTALAEDADGRVWVGTHRGLAVVTNGRFETPAGLPANLPTVQAILQIRGGAVLLGTEDGVYVADGARSRWLTNESGLAIDDARVLVEARNGDVWIGGYGGLTRMRGEQFDRWTEAQGLPSNNVRAVYEDASGDVWVGTYDGGIGRLHGNRWSTINRTHGLFDNGAFQILEDNRGYFWFSSNRGIYRVARRQLDDVTSGRASSVDAVSYGPSDGMLSAECNGGTWPSGAKDDNGHLWFPTQAGVAVVDPESLTIVTEPPRVAIEEVTLDGASLGVRDRITIKPGQANLVIHYTALTYSRPEQTTFRYRLDGVDTDWHDAGLRRRIDYSHLPPGLHRFRLIARNSDGVVSAAESTLAIEVVPPFYRRWWFFAGLCAGSAAAISLAWNRRVNQLLAKQAAQQAFAQQLIASQEQERRRIAADLHDSLGQRLVVINNLARLLLRKKTGTDSDADRLETIAEIGTEASAAIEETRAISYALRPFQLDRLGLTKAVEGVIRTAGRASTIAFTDNIADIDDAFPEDLRINFFRIVQEGVNNIVKHSRATAADVTVTRNAQGVVLTIRDNGEGLGARPSPAAGTGGFGMTGLQERALLLQGTLQVESEPGRGTLLTFDFPTPTSA